MTTFKNTFAELYFRLRRMAYSPWGYTSPAHGDVVNVIKSEGGKANKHMSEPKNRSLGKFTLTPTSILPSRPHSSVDFASHPW